MTTPTPENDRFPYPRDTVVAIAGDETAVSEAAGALVAAGLGEARVDVLRGPEGAARIDPDGRGHGALGELERRLQKLWGDEASLAREYAARLEQGGDLVAVSVSDRDQAHAAGAVFAEAGLTDVRYFSRFTIEVL